MKLPLYRQNSILAEFCHRGHTQRQFFFGFLKLNFRGKKRSTQWGLHQHSKLSFCIGGGGTKGKRHFPCRGCSSPLFSTSGLLMPDPLTLCYSTRPFILDWPVPSMRSLWVPTDAGLVTLHPAFISPTLPVFGILPSPFTSIPPVGLMWWDTSEGQSVYYVT